MTLYTETTGQGPPLVFIHGWGVHCGFWTSTTERLNPDFTTTLFDLPGHGHSPLPRGSYGLPTLVDEISKLIKENTTLIGWSMGGMIAMAIARQFSERILRLILVASTPQFRTAPGWPHAMAAEMLALFAQQLEYPRAGHRYPRAGSMPQRVHRHHTGRTLQRFLALQVHGCHNARQTTRAMQTLLKSRPIPHPQALQGGLDILRSTNLRPTLAQISCPTLIIHGDRDAIIPYQVTQAFSQHMADVRIEIIPGAGHIPFLTHPNEFIRLIQDFCCET